MGNWGRFWVGVIVGFYVAFILIAVAVKDREKVIDGENGLFIEHSGKIYYLNEIKVGDSAIFLKED